MELEDFFTTVWGDSEGTVCLTFKTPEGAWNETFWKYPLELPKILTATTAGDNRGDDCYFIPSVLRGASSKKLAFQQSRVAWVDLDGGTVAQLPSVPSVLVETSPEHFHAYWVLDEVTRNIEALESANRGLMALSGADHSGWDATQVLRIPYTHSKKRDCPVVLRDLSPTRFTLGALPKWNAPLLNLVAPLQTVRS